VGRRERGSFAWLTRRYDHYATSLLADYESAPNADTAWDIFNAYRRSGDWKAAAEWGRASIDKYKAAGHWAGLDTEMAWTELLAQEYDESRARWEKLAKRGGPAGREAEFYAGLSAYMLADPTSAEDHFAAVISAGREWVDGAYYWRSKSRSRAGDAAGAEADRVATIDNDTSGWYSLLLDDAPASADSSSWVARDGLWHGPAETTVPAWQKVPTGIPTIGTAPARELEMPPAENTGWGRLTWASLSAPASAEPDPVAPALPTVDAQVPDGISACSWYDPVAAKKLFRDFSDAHADVWPTLPAAYDLAQAGMDEDAGALVHDAIEEWRDAQETRTDDPRAVPLRAIAVEPADWRQIALAARDYNHAARMCWGLSRHADTEEDRLGALRLEYPIVGGRSVWSYSRAFGVDPLLALGIMRQESVYLPTALSVSNAMGLVQVLPSTGAKVAALLGETRYTPGDLEVPDTNLRYGIYYMSLLLRRFDGVYPLAVASYNGGPHNVSRWLKAFPDGADVDVFVEHIPVKETRDYVKKVSGHYAQYASIYGPGGQPAKVVVPERTLGDHAEIVDF
jgi:soluble lytic murein transglycosylase-like protein